MVLIMFVKRDKETAIRWIANITAFAGFLVSILLIFDDRHINSDGSDLL
jgi:hypothetical protein